MSKSGGKSAKGKNRNGKRGKNGNGTMENGDYVSGRPGAPVESSPDDLAALDALHIAPVHTNKQLKLGPSSAVADAIPSKPVIRYATQQLLVRLEQLQAKFHADARYALLLVLQGRDASGKDGTIRTVMGAFNPIGVRVAAFGPPTREELAHDYLWRVHQVIPPRRMIGVFNRSHYEDVLAVRVRELVPEPVWRRRFEQINNFEKMLAQNDVVIRKCFLHISRDEQERRLRERMHDPEKNWKFRLEDLDDRAKWDAYTDAYRDVLTLCSTKHAPWYVVPSDDKGVRNYLVAKMLVETLEGLDLRYPPMDEGVRAAAEAAQW